MVNTQLYMYRDIRCGSPISELSTQRLSGFQDKNIVD